MTFRRLKPIDLALLVGVGLVWLVCFTLHLGQILRGELAWVPVYVSPAAHANSFPKLIGFWHDAETDAPGLALGDRLLAVGTRSLGGVSNIGFDARVYAEARARGHVTLHFERDGIAGQAVLKLVPVLYPWRATVLALALGAIAVAVLWRGRGTSLARYVFGACAFASLYWCYFFGRTPLQTYAGAAVFALGPAIAFPAAIRALLSFPVEVARRDRWSSIWPWCFALIGVAIATWAFGVPLPPRWGRPLALVANLALATTLITLLGVNYRRSGAAGRRQLRWVLFGIYLACVPPLLAAWVGLFAPRLWWIFEVSQLSWLALPICAFIAIDRFNALDIDRLISASAAFTILSVAVVGGFGVAVPRTAAAVSQSTSIDPLAVHLVFGIGVAAVLLPAQRMLKARIDRLLFAERYALERGGSDLRAALAACDKRDELLQVLGERLTGLLRPHCTVVYRSDGGAYVPFFVHGPAAAPQFDPEGPLLTWLEMQGAAVGAAQLQRASRHGMIGRLERAALAGMGAEVLLPVVRGGSLSAFVCLGEKRSGDVYTSTDLALLSTIADRASDQLLHYDDAEVRRREREVHDRLRRYVPRAVAEHAVRGDLDVGECEVSILFVDIRGYAGLTEGHDAEAIFSVINRYTTAVSGFVTAHGGVVVEFNGDGMMAVFGAPDALEHKESAALRAARAIVRGVRSLAIGPGASIGVGVGIATGTAFVGSIRAVDRLIWSAIGNTTNLASRLQELTRDLDAAIVIDVATHRDCGDEAGGFEIVEHFMIRGLREPVDIYSLPRSEAG